MNDIPIFVKSKKTILSMHCNIIHFVIIAIVSQLQRCGASCVNGTNCIMEASLNPGQYSLCDMCMCDNFHKYTGGNKCGGNPEVYFRCYVRIQDGEWQCKTKMRTEWIIALAIVGFELLLLCCCAMFICCTKKRKHRK